MCGGNISVTHTTAYTLTIHYNEYIHKGLMRHLVPFTPDQLSIIETSLEASLKYADSEYISEVDAILKEIKDNTSILRS